MGSQQQEDSDLNSPLKHPLLSLCSGHLPLCFFVELGVLGADRASGLALPTTQIQPPLPHASHPHWHLGGQPAVYLDEKK